jgi:Semialdehyde dehydrogenase, NAD binding domain.
MTKSIENAIVIGATGLVGRELVRQLSQNARCKNITLWYVSVTMN